MIDQKRPLPDDFFKDWKQREALAEGMIPIIGKLYRERNVSTYMYGNSMVNKSVTDLMKFHRRVRQVEQNELSEFDSSPMIEAIARLHLGPAHIDLGKMVVKFKSIGNGRSVDEFVADELKDNDEEIVRNSIHLRWIGVRRDLKELIKPAIILADWHKSDHPNPTSI